jgi:hypothetical protein
MVKITRTAPRAGLPEVPWKYRDGFYRLADPTLEAKNRNKEPHATKVRTLEDAARLVLEGYALRMGAPDKRPSRIARRSLKVTI